jgi:hypothetical protein
MIERENPLIIPINHNNNVTEMNRKTQATVSSVFAPPVFKDYKTTHDERARAPAVPGIPNERERASDHSVTSLIKTKKKLKKSGVSPLSIPIFRSSNFLGSPLLFFCSPWSLSDTTVFPRIRRRRSFLDRVALKSAHSPRSEGGERERKGGW